MKLGKHCTSVTPTPQCFPPMTQCDGSMRSTEGPLFLYCCHLHVRLNGRFSWCCSAWTVSKALEISKKWHRLFTDVFHVTQPTASNHWGEHKPRSAAWPHPSSTTGRDVSPLRQLSVKSKWAIRRGQPQPKHNKSFKWVTAWNVCSSCPVANMTAKRTRPSVLLT